MEGSPTVHVKTSIKNRSKRIVRDYFTHDEDEKIKKIISKLKVHLTNKGVQDLHELVDEKRYEQVAQFLLETYYDKQYSHALQNKTYVKEISGNDVDEAVKELERLKSGENSV